MKRFATASIAATTALSLAVMPTGAEETKPERLASSQVTDEHLAAYVFAAILTEELKPGSGFSGPMMGSSKAGMFDFKDEKDSANFDAVANSSIRNDVANGYKLGTTFDILVGTGIAAAVLALLGGVAVLQGLIKLPF